MRPASCTAHTYRPSGDTCVRVGRVPGVGGRSGTGGGGCEGVGLPACATCVRHRPSHACAPSALCCRPIATPPSPSPPTPARPPAACSTAVRPHLDGGNVAVAAAARHLLVAARQATTCGDGGCIPRGGGRRSGGQRGQPVARGWADWAWRKGGAAAVSHLVAVHAARFGHVRYACTVRAAAHCKGWVGKEEAQARHYCPRPASSGSPSPPPASTPHRQSGWWCWCSPQGLDA